MVVRLHRRLAVGLVTVVLVAAFAPALLAGGATVTRGDIHADNGSTLPIAGNATMIRTADGRTIVTIQVTGLEPGRTYAAHVHALACDAFSGHYRFDPEGASTPPNEIWPGPFIANAAGNGRGDTVAEGTAAPSAASVVIHAPGGTRIACADLS